MSVVKGETWFTVLFLSCAPPARPPEARLTALVLSAAMSRALCSSALSPALPGSEAQSTSGIPPGRAAGVGTGADAAVALLPSQQASRRCCTSTARPGCGDEVAHGSFPAPHLHGVSVPRRRRAGPGCVRRWTPGRWPELASAAALTPAGQRARPSTGRRAASLSQPGNVFLLPGETCHLASQPGTRKAQRATESMSSPGILCVAGRRWLENAINELIN